MPSLKIGSMMALSARTAASSSGLSANKDNKRAPIIISVMGGFAVDEIMTLNRLPERGETIRVHKYHSSLGGKAANTAITLCRACHDKPDSEDPYTNDEVGESQNHLRPGDSNDADTRVSEMTVKVIGRIGDDGREETFRDILREHGIEESGLKVVNGHPTGRNHVVVEQFSGENRSMYCPGANETLVEEDFNTVEDLGNGDRPDLVIAQLDIRKDVIEHVAEIAGKAKVEFLLSANPAHPIARETYKYLTHLIINETAAGIMSGRKLHEVTVHSWPRIAQEFIGRGVQNVVITLGEKGAYFATATESGHVPAYKVEEVVDTTGAGDTFTGVYASEYMSQRSKGVKWDIRAAIIRANKACAIMIRKLGAQEGIPWADEIEHFEAEVHLPALVEGDRVRRLSQMRGW